MVDRLQAGGRRSQEELIRMNIRSKVKIKTKIEIKVRMGVKTIAAAFLALCLCAAAAFAADDEKEVDRVKDAGDGHEGNPEYS